MQLVLLKKHSYGTRSLVPGDTDEVLDAHGEVLIKLGIAKRVVEDEEDSNERPSRRRTGMARIRL